MSLVQTVERFARIESRLDVIEATMATKADLAALEIRLIKWFVGTAVTMTTIVASIAFAAARFIH